MLNIETGDRYAPLNMSPQRQKEKTIEAIAEQMAGIARHGRVLVIFEVAHWTNPTTLEVLEAVIGRIENEPMLQVITFRPEFDFANGRHRDPTPNTHAASRQSNNQFR